MTNQQSLAEVREHARRWADRARATAEKSLSPEKLRSIEPDTFRDELGQRRAHDNALIESARSGRMPEVVADDALGALWHARFTHADASVVLPLRGSGHLLEHPGRVTIEVFTEHELQALHVLWHIALDRGDDALRVRCFDAAAWHIEHLQPDNATNLPWALAVFAMLAATDPQAGLHAQTVLHNCQIMLGKPDMRSALILHDAANQLDSSAASTEST